MTKRSLLTCLLLPLVSAIPAHADFLGVSFGGNFVVRFNELTGANQRIGLTSPDAGLIASLTRDPVTGTFYTVGGLQAGGVATVLTLDPNTGLTTPVAPLSRNLNIQALAVPPGGGLLYATSDLDNTLYTIDPRTGQVAAIGSLGAAFTYVHSLAFASDGLLYGYTNNGGEAHHSGPGFFRVDPVTGATTVLTPTGVNPLLLIEDLAFAPNGVLWATNGGLFEPLDLQTGLAAGPGFTAPYNIHGMAFFPAATVPEPAPLFLLGAGLAALALTRRRRY